MEHLAILDKKIKLLSKIICAEKTIESRWYKSKKTPYDSISENDVIYFKESGEPVTVKARVRKVLFFDDLNEKKIKGILQKYGREICMPVSYRKNLEGKKYCTLMFIDEIQRITPFDVDKKGFGMMAAWITVENMDKIKRIVARR